MAPHSSTLAWKIPWTEEPVRLQSIGLLRVGHDWATSLSLFTFMHWRRQWQPTPVLAWRIPGTGEPGGLPSVGSHRVGHDWSNLTAAYISFCTQCCCTLTRLQYCISVTYMHWETKKFVWLALLWNSIYCDGLEPNPQYLQGMPVFRNSLISFNSILQVSEYRFYMLRNLFLSSLPLNIVVVGMPTFWAGKAKICV